MAVCPAIKLVGETSVSGSISAMDCQIEQAVQTGYERLFGAGGAFGTVLTTVLAIYVALLAYGFIFGRTRLTLAMMSPRLTVMVLVLTFVTVWPAYHTIFYGLFMGGPDEVASAILGQKGSAVMGFAENLDRLFVRFAEIANKLEATSSLPGATPNLAIVTSKSMPVTLFWLSGLLLLFSTLGVLILSRLVLNLLLILGPLFIIMALFSQTRGLFNGWIRTSLIFALMPLLTVLGGTAALALFIPLLEVIASDPQTAVAQVQPMVILFMGSMIYAAFIMVLMWVAASLVHDWQAALRDKPASGFPRSDQVVIQGQGQAGGATSSYATGGNDTRIEAMNLAVTRQNLGLNSASRVEVGAVAPAGSTGRVDRVEGLGQRFRPAKPGLSAQTGSLSGGTSKS